MGKHKTQELSSLDAERTFVGIESHPVLAESLENFFKIGNVLLAQVGLDDNIIDLNFNISSDHDVEYMIH